MESLTGSAEQRRNGPALRMAADDDVADTQGFHGEFNRGGGGIGVARALAGGTMLPTFLTTNKSPGLLCVMSSASTRESEQVMNSVCGFWPSCDSLRKSFR